MSKRWSSSYYKTSLAETSMLTTRYRACRWLYANRQTPYDQKPAIPASMDGRTILANTQSQTRAGFFVKIEQPSAYEANRANGPLSYCKRSWVVKINAGTNPCAKLREPRETGKSSLSPLTRATLR